MNRGSAIGEAPRRRHLDAGGVRFSYRAAGGGTATGPGAEAGTGPPLVLLHGIGSNARSWREQLAGLGGLRAIVAWDAPGYGDSTPVARPRPAAADYADRLARFLDGLGLDRIVLLGHSLGALVAGAFAAARPDRVERLILANAALGHRADPAAPLPPPAQDRLDDLAALGPAGLAAKRAPRLLSVAATPAQVARARAAMAEIHPDGYRQAVAMLAQGDLAADAGAVAARTLVLSASEDSVTPPAGSRALAAAMPNARYHEIPDAGHLSYLERPAAFNAAVHEFLTAP